MSPSDLLSHCTGYGCASKPRRRDCAPDPDTAPKPLPCKTDLARIRKISSACAERIGATISDARWAHSGSSLRLSDQNFREWTVRLPFPWAGLPAPGAACLRRLRAVTPGSARRAASETGLAVPGDALPAENTIESVRCGERYQNSPPRAGLAAGRAIVRNPSLSAAVFCVFAAPGASLPSGTSPRPVAVRRMMRNGREQ